ncbi:MAG: patatin-like phospholipase family protein [Pseudomonadota bacterium]|nr:patatin-like phospholipase family protein [Pseudomonadota bacterium]
MAVAALPYQHAMLFAGGGRRFGYYLGSYAAAVECGRPPDLIVASCGGAIAAAMIQIEPSIHAQQQWLYSRDLYAVFQRFQAKQTQRLIQHVGYAAVRSVASALLSACHTPNLTRWAMFDVADEDKTPLFDCFDVNRSQDTASVKSRVDIAIVGSQILDQSHETTFQPVLFSPSVRLQQHLKTVPDSILSPDSLIQSTWQAKRKIASDFQWAKLSLPEAVRMSISDMFYLPPLVVNQRQYLGGVLNLTPFELLLACAQRCTLEVKSVYSRGLAAPAIQSVFGFDPNRRLRDYHDLMLLPHADELGTQISWFDSSDASRCLPQGIFATRLHLRSLQLMPIFPSYAEYQAIMAAHWQYGYQRGLEAFSTSLQPPRIRHYSQSSVSAQLYQRLTKG